MRLFIRWLHPRTIAAVRVIVGRPPAPSLRHLREPIECRSRGKLKSDASPERLPSALPGGRLPAVFDIDTHSHPGLPPWPGIRRESINFGAITLANRIVEKSVVLICCARRKALIVPAAPIHPQTALPVVLAAISTAVLAG